MSEFVGLRIGAVHEEHTVSEYYCGGCGWPVTDHDSYCPECGGAFHESDADDALEVENEKLREQGERLFDKTLELATENVRLQDENARLRSCLSDDAENARMIMGENAKLRELVRELYHELDAATQYEAGGSRGVVCEFADTMRELGVEVER